VRALDSSRFDFSVDSLVLGTAGNATRTTVEFDLSTTEKRHIDMKAVCLSHGSFLPNCLANKAMSTMFITPS
jgi:hypothetical protein